MASILSCYAPFPDEQSHLRINLHARYNGWMQVEQDLNAVPTICSARRFWGRIAFVRSRPRRQCKSLDAFIDFPDEIGDYDLAGLLKMLKSGDSALTINTERDF